MADLPTGTVTFLFTDVEGSTRLWEQHPAAMRDAVARHEVLLREAIGAHNGHVFRTVGDGICAAFATAPNALGAALAAQRALRAEPWGETGPLRVRMALHTGAADAQAGDYVGACLNRVARLLAAAHGGQVLFSLASEELVRDVLPADAGLRDLGDHWLKDLERPERVFQLVHPELLADYPSLRSLGPPNNLPSQFTSFVGREQEMEEVRQRLRRPEVRLLTLTGPAGAGKSRLAIEAAARLDQFPDGVFFVPLATVREPALMAAAIVRALGAVEVPRKPILETLKACLGAKRLLLVLDNFEQVRGAAAQLAEVLAAAPHVKALITSRATLHLYGEQELPVAPLALPDLTRRSTPANVGGCEAVRLFVERARAVRPDFALTAANASAIAETCVRLDGLPLALELAAARCKVLTPRAMLARLAKRLELLTGGARDLPTRQQTLREAIAWSYDLLPEGERRLFARLGVFTGGCTIAAVEAVCGVPGELPMDVLNGLASLVDQSLLEERGAAEGEPRFRMLETIREYALECLAERGEMPILQRQHAEHYLALAEAEEPDPDTYEVSAAWLAQVEAERDNLRAVLERSHEPGGSAEIGLRLVAGLSEFWFHRGPRSEGYRWLRTALERREAPPKVQAKALLLAGNLGWMQREPSWSSALLEQSLTLYRAAGDKQGAAWALLYWGWTAREQGDYRRAAAMMEESLELFREQGPRRGVAATLRNLGAVAYDQGDCARADALIRESLLLCRSTGNRLWEGFALLDLGRVAFAQGDHVRAMGLFQECLSLYRHLNQVDGIAEVLLYLGRVTRAQGEGAQAGAFLRESLDLNWRNGNKLWVSEGLAGLAGLLGEPGAAPGQHSERARRAARLFGAAEALRAALETPLPLVDRAAYDRDVAAVHTQLAQVTFTTAWAEGRAMAPEEAVASALVEEVDA